MAAALLGARYLFLRRSPRAGAPRVGRSCMMASCPECLVLIGGEVVQSCLAEVTDGMVVRLDRGA